MGQQQKAKTGRRDPGAGGARGARDVRVGGGRFRVHAFFGGEMGLSHPL
jgi:hypothetical protein